jgi:hypothetical protein
MSFAPGRSAEKLIRPVMPELDSLRGIAILLVLCFHGFDHPHLVWSQFKGPARFFISLAGQHVLRCGIPPHRGEFILYRRPGRNPSVRLQPFQMDCAAPAITVVWRDQLWTLSLPHAGFRFRRPLDRPFLSRNLPADSFPVQLARDTLHNQHGARGRLLILVAKVLRGAVSEVERAVDETILSSPASLRDCEFLERNRTADSLS